MKPIVHLRLGVGEVLLGRYQAGLDHLTKAGEIGLAHFFQGLALENLQRWAEAAEAFAAAAKAGYDAKRSDLHRAALRRAGNVEAASAAIAKLENLAGSSAEYHYQQGSLLAADGELAAAAGRAREGPRPRPRPHRRPVRAGLHQRPLRQRRDRRRLLQATAPSARPSPWPP